MFGFGRPFQFKIIFACKARNVLFKWSPVRGSLLWALTFPAYITLGCKRIAVPNTLAYYDTTTITVVKHTGKGPTS